MAESNEQEKALASDIAQKFKDAMLAKESITAAWMEYLNAWNNSLYEDQSVPSYRSNQNSNFIFSTIESMRPIMFDGHPQFDAIPVTLEAMQFAGDVNQVMDYEWDRTRMQQKMIANSIYTLCVGTSIIMLTQETGTLPGDDKDGNVKPVPVNPFNLFPDPLATNIEDAEYLIYATYVHENLLKKMYPDKAEGISGGSIQYSELVNSRDEGSSIKNQVLVLEMWSRDYTTIESEEEADGVTVKKVSQKYPLGRVTVVAPDLNIVLKDEANPYQSGRFPFFLFKDIDVPFKFWGEGDVKWLLSPQQSINDLSNQIIDNARHTANAAWVIDKNAGIPLGTLTNRPGLVIRKNPGSSVDRISPPSMPMYVSEKINSLKGDIEVISGVHDVTRGQTPTGIESGSAIQALQEAAQTRIRLKIQIMDCSIGELGTEWFERIKQFWKFNRLIPKKDGITPEGQPQYDFIEIAQDKQLSQSFKIKIVGASTANTNTNSMLDLMIRLAQTMAEDQMPMVTRDAVLDFLPKVNKDRILQHFQKKQQEQMALAQQQQMGQQQVEGIQGILGGLTQQVQGINNDLGGVQQRFSKQDQEEQENELKLQGYEQGVKESYAMDAMAQEQETIPQELLEQMATMSDEELEQFLIDNPELASAI